MKLTSLTGLGDRELELLLDGIDGLVSEIASRSVANATKDPDWDSLARMRERLLAARRRVRA